ncbi:hypothetical protein HDU67_007869 [Dinochytrium kinnereticum]|nr:hypothetical protein HDU67_007869 [Dinochytrium kinnereticum]
MENKRSKCIATIKKTERRCKNYAATDSKYCKCHLPDSPTCQGICKDGKPCKMPPRHQSVYCGHHGEGQERCAGTGTDQKPCQRYRRGDSPYCCNSHDPSINFANTDWLRGKNVRDRYLKDFPGELMDRYLEKHVEDPEEIEVDHVVEIHLGTLCVNRVVTECKDKKQVLDRLKFGFNHLNNLNPTTRLINDLKFNGFASFASDYDSGRVNPAGVVYYFRENEIFNRKITANICKETQKSFGFIINSFQPDSNPENEACEELKKLMEKMNLGRL